MDQVHQEVHGLGPEGCRESMFVYVLNNACILQAVQLRVRFLGKYKNGSWIHKIHTLSEFFGSNPNSNFWDSQSGQSEHFFEKRNRKGIFDKRFSEQKWYTVVWHSHWTYVGDALYNFESLVTFHSMFVICLHS